LASADAASATNPRLNLALIGRPRPSRAMG
jgi:hypothetical protein